MGRLIGKKAIQYALRRIDFVNPANKLVSKFAPPNWRPTLFKAVKLSEALIGGKTAYDIYMMLAPDSPGNGSFPSFEKSIKYTPRTSGKARFRRARRYCPRNSRNV